MERVHQLVVAGTLSDEDNWFWGQCWPFIASAKVPLEKKIATYHALERRGIADFNAIRILDLYDMLRADRIFVANFERDLNKGTATRYRLCIAWVEDDVAAFSKWYLDSDEYGSLDMQKYDIRHLTMKTNAARCIRFLLQEKVVREWVVQDPMTPLTQRLVEELIQPTDHLEKRSLLWCGQSMKLIGMCVSDDELVAEWLPLFTKADFENRGRLSVPFARKLYALATPEQRVVIRDEVAAMMTFSKPDEGCLELAWIFWLLAPFDTLIQQRLMRYDVSLFPAFTFAMIVGMCDGYLEVTSPEISESRRRFFTLMARLPMDLQALVSLRLYERTSTVIRREAFDRAFLATVWMHWR
jgi:hypothetical protein